jgi:uncharacterized OB-fold protein
MTERIFVRDDIFAGAPDDVVLVANKCISCGQTFFPKVDQCLSCFHEAMEEVPLGRRGKLYSYTIAFMPSTHFHPPYAIGYVDMPEGVRIFAPLQMVDGKPFATGMEMEVVIGTLWQQGEKEVVGYRFQPV